MWIFLDLFNTPHDFPFVSIPLLTVRRIATDPWLANPMVEQPFCCSFARPHFYAVFIVRKIIRIVIVVAIVIGIRIPIIVIRMPVRVTVWV